MESNKPTLFDRFFDGDLNASEEKEFLRQIQNDQKLKAEFETQLLLNKAFDHLHREKVRQSLIEADKNMPSVRKTKVLSLRQKLSWVAAASVLFVFATFFWMHSAEKTNREIFTEHFEPYQNVYKPILRSGESQNSGGASEIMNLYERGEFDSAIRLYESELQEHQDNEDLQFYMGIAYLGVSNTNKAIELLSDIDESSKYNKMADWYLALSYLLADQNERAKKLLQNLDYNQDQVNDILQEIDNN